MAKSAQAFRTIREVADWLDVAAHVLRFWESKFSQIKPVKRAGGRRYYRPADMELVGGIKVLLHDRGLTIRGVQKMIADEGLEAVTALSPPVDELIADEDTIEGDATGAWDSDTAAEVLDTPLAQALLGPDTDPAPSDAPDTPAPDSPADDATGQTLSIETPTTEIPATGAPMPDLGRLPSSGTPSGRDAPDPSPADEAPTTDTDGPSKNPRPAPSTILPASDPAEGPLGKLTAFTQLPIVKRAALAPHIAALARLRDRMSAPTDSQ
ncbi:MerR family transcriptional regulator [Jannaschia sp. CCS1]|uniref:MerR family transcriptional regulator n=1 Tax=Jannaschia sp. (strain CCS1) TaxID=290400 RepID=UPI000053CCF4|nr:MerR family transcriptional regulator [Jannaschia sp. CCS1]ABD54699.1 transcriptional regulator, MerR family [Jannaschia sp. CCS1]